MTELTQNIWARYGFNHNPFDTKALSQTGIIPIQEAYIERAGTTRPGKLLNYFLGIPGRGSIAIEGKPGEGKTTFVNYYKYLWKTKSRKEKLFSSETEISVQGNWDTETFILSALGSLCGQLKLELGDSKVNRNKLLKEILGLTSVLLQSDRGLSATALGFGASISKSTSVTLGKQTENSLSDYLRRLVSYIQTLGYNGAIIHFNNMDLLQKDKDCDLHSLFDSIRDVLQISGLYFVFVGTIGLYSSVIIPLDRVRSIFYDEPIVIDPFSEGQVVSLINTRYNILNKDKKWIKPVDDSVIRYLYNCFQGDIRDIMNTLTNLMSRIPESFNNTLTLNDVKEKLKVIEFQKLKNQGLTEKELEVLKEILKLDKFTNASLGQVTTKSKQNINKYIRRFEDLKLIELLEKVGRNSYYTISPRLKLLKTLFK